MPSWSKGGNACAAVFASLAAKRTSRSCEPTVLTNWTHWLSSLHPDQLLVFLLGLLLTDTPRYALSKLLLCLWDCGSVAWCWLRGALRPPAFTYCPSVGVVIAGFNEADTIEGTLRTLWGTYPRLEIVVIDNR